jgi:hypothetical protein
MYKDSIKKLQLIFENIPALLEDMEENIFSFKENGKWSKKEILGHLIDSATTNHHRFVRGQFENIPSIQYDQNKWNEFNYYQNIEKSQLISFWKFYNLQLIALIELIPTDKLNKEVNTGSNLNSTIEFLIDDYVEHLEHHLKQIILN